MPDRRTEKPDPDLPPAAPDFSFETALWQAGVLAVAGIDEAGRGALAGPVAAAALVFPPDPAIIKLLHGVNDSKQLSRRARETWAERLPALALACAVGMASVQEIDEIGIVPATRLAAQRALAEIKPAPQHLLLDYLVLPESPLPQTALVKGDARCLSIAAASIMAKTARDALLHHLDLEFPGYGLAVHKGYGTLAHRQAIMKLGLSPIHRRSFTIKAII